MGRIVSKLNTDNKDTMPITESVYGPKGKHDKPAKPPRGHGFRPQANALYDLLAQMAGGSAKRKAAQHHHKEKHHG